MVIISRVACRCLWDSDTDNYAQEIFMNVSLTFIFSEFYGKDRDAFIGNRSQGGAVLTLTS